MKTFVTNKIFVCTRISQKVEKRQLSIIINQRIKEMKTIMATIINRSECLTKIISSIFQRVRYISTFAKNRKDAIFEFRRDNGNEGSENLERIDYGVG